MNRRAAFGGFFSGLPFTLAVSLAMAGCAGVKTEPSEDFSDLEGLDQKSDAFSYRMKIVGSLDYGQVSSSTKHSGTPRFLAYKLSGKAGDAVSVWVRSPDGDARFVFPGPLNCCPQLGAQSIARHRKDIAGVVA